MTHISVVVEGFLLSFWTIVQTFTFELKNVRQLPCVVGRVQDKQRSLDVRIGVLEKGDGYNQVQRLLTLPIPYNSWSSLM